MSFTDFLTEFEKLDICYVPDESKTNYHRVIGDFAGGENAPKSVNELSSNFLNPAMTHQVDIIVKEKAQDVFIQLLLDCTGELPAILLEYVQISIFSTQTSFRFDQSFRWIARKRTRIHSKRIARSRTVDSSSFTNAGWLYAWTI